MGLIDSGGDVGAEVAAVLADLADLIEREGHMPELAAREIRLLAPLIAVRVEAAKAEALREAAAVLSGKWITLGNPDAKGYATWLRDRAAALGPGPRP